MPDLATAWNPAPAVLATGFVALILFGHAFVRLRRRGRTDHAGWGRLVLFVLGIACIVLPLTSPLDELGDHYLLSAHMLEHVLIDDVAPALLVLAVRGPLLVFLLPASILRPTAQWHPLRTVLAFLLKPQVSIGAWIGVIAAWHVPAFYDYALNHPLVHDAEHASFILCGLLVWTQLIDPARTGALSTAQRLVCAGILFAFGQILSDILVLLPTPAYPAYAAQSHRVFGFSALHDQRLAGLTMMGEQLLTLGTFTVLMLRPRFQRNVERLPARTKAI